MFKVPTLAAGISAVALSLSFGTAASASTMTYLTYDGINVTPAEIVRVKAADEHQNLRVYAGGFNMVEGTDSFLAWCIDLLDSIKSADFEKSRPGQVSDAEQTDLQRLFNGHRLGAQADAVTAAAFQVAIWEIVYETSGTYSLSAGNFSAHENDTVVTAAQGLLDNLGSVDGPYKLRFYNSSTSQDLVAASVPLPASAFLMLAGIGGLAAARRRKKS